MKAVLAATIFALAASNSALGDTFGSGANTFDIEFVTVGNPGNAPDTTGNPAPPYPTGSVAYAYRMGKYEISRDMVTKANTAGNLQITLFDMTANGGNGVNRPATGISWNEAARFVNWLNLGMGSPPAYKFAVQPGQAGYNANDNIQLWSPSDTGYNPNNLYRNSLAKYFLPSVDEWYKAAYYDPTNGVYYDYPTGSDTEPTPVTSGTTAGTAVYGQPYGQGPADITLAGGLSPYGTMAQGGNGFELEETDWNMVNGPLTNSFRFVRGSDWSFRSDPTSLYLRSSSPEIIFEPIDGPGPWFSFRVASIAIPGDFNDDGTVDAADYVAWRKNDGTQTGYDTWQAHFGPPQSSGSAFAVPEPSTILLTIAAMAGLSTRRRTGCPMQRGPNHQLVPATLVALRNE